MTQQSLQILRSNGVEISLEPFISKVLKKAIAEPREDLVLLAVEAGGHALKEMISLDPKLKAAILLGGQDIIDWFLNMFLVGAMTTGALESNSLTLSIVNEEVNELNTKEDSDRSSQADGTNPD